MSTPPNVPPSAASRGLLFKTLVVGVLLVGGGLAYFLFQPHQLPPPPPSPHVVVEPVKNPLVVDAAKLLKEIEAASKVRMEAEQLEAKDIAKHPKPDEQQKLIKEAEATHQQRMSRAAEFAKEFAELASAHEASPVLLEMVKQLEKDGVKAALAYFEAKRKTVMDGVATGTQHPDLQLQPVALAAGIQALTGDVAAASASYTELLKRNATGPVALHGFAWFLFDESCHAEAKGDLSGAIANAEACLAMAQRLSKLDSKRASVQRLLRVGHYQVADVMVLRGTPADTEAAILHYQQSLALGEAELQATPKSSAVMRDLSVVLNKLGDLLHQRARQGDLDLAQKSGARSLELAERLLEAEPNSTQALRDVAVSLDKLASVLSERNGPGDVEAARKYFTRDLEISEKLWKARPGSAEAVRDLLVSHNKLAAFEQKQGDKAAEELHSRACYDLLQASLAKGMGFDAPVIQLHAQLQARFAGK